MPRTASALRGCIGRRGSSNMKRATASFRSWPTCPVVFWAGSGKIVIMVKHGALSTKHRALGTEHRALGTEHRALGTEHRALGTEHRARRAAAALMFVTVMLAA